MKETVFLKTISQNKEKLELLNSGVKQMLVQSYDASLIIKLRHLYYGGIPGSIFLYMYPSAFHNMGEKAMLLSIAFENEDYKIVHGNVDSIKNTNFHQHNNEHIDLNTWIEVNRGDRTWVYDLFSLMKFDKDLYYKLENPEIKRITLKSKAIDVLQPDQSQFKHLGDDKYVLPMILPNMEESIENSPYYEYLKAELSRFKKEINYDDIIRENAEDMKMHGYK